MATFCVYCGSNFGNHPRFAEQARLVGKLLAEKNHTLVYGGGTVGLMGAVADEVLASGGKVIGVIPKLFIQKKREVAHSGLTKLYIVDSMHERKEKMAALSDGFLALPGGIGTLEEIMEVFTWTQIGIHPKPCALLNRDGFYDPLVKMLASMVEQGFLHDDHFSQLIVHTDPEVIFEKMLIQEHRMVDKWTNA